MPSRFIYYAMEEQALQAYIDLKNLVNEKSLDLSEEHIAKIKAEITAYRDNDRLIYTVDDNGTAHINIVGALEPKMDPCAVFFGIEMTTYEDIFKGVEAANANFDVKDIMLHFDTPGGNIVGLFKTADVIYNSVKPVSSIVHGMAASAGYALISQSKNIAAENVSIEVGSIGVMTERIDRSEADRKNGITRRTLFSKNAINKNPDAATEEGREKIISRLTEFETVFVDYVARGRNTTAENVNRNYGQGAMLIAKKALSVGMIDSITSDIYNVQNQKTTESTKEKTEGANQMAGEQIVLTQEQLDALVDKAVTKAADTATAKIKSDLEAKEKKESAETKRKAGFNTLLTKYPNQAEMINAEMTKEGAEATADFGIKVHEAEVARKAAEDAQKKGSDQSLDALKGGGANESKDADNFIASMKGVV